MALKTQMKIKFEDIERETIAIARRVTGGKYGEGKPPKVSTYSYEEINGIWACLADGFSSGQLPEKYIPCVRDLLQELDL